jgi:hypothetical protein
MSGTERTLSVKWHQGSVCTHRGGLSALLLDSISPEHASIGLSLVLFTLTMLPIQGLSFFVQPMFLVPQTSAETHSLGDPGFEDTKSKRRNEA